MPIIIKRGPPAPKPDPVAQFVGLAPASGIDEFKPGEKVKIVKGYGTWYELFQDGDTAEVLRSFVSQGMWDKRPGSDVYLIRLDKPRVKGKSEVYVHYGLLGRVDVP